MLFRLENVARELSGEPLFRGISVQFNPGDRVGLIGRNGCGKTTLLDIIEGKIQPDLGSVHRAGVLTVSRVPQRPAFDPSKTVREEALGVFDELREMERELRRCEEEMSRHRDDVAPEPAEFYGNLRARFEVEGGYDYAARTEAVLFGLGFDRKLVDAPCSHLSGGRQSRLLLAQALLRPCRLLMLDEPTNHLDLEGILWLTEYLQALVTPLLLISHDREFLDRVTTRTWEFEGATLHDYPAPYTRSRRLRLERREQRRKEYQRQQEWKARSEDFIRRNIAGQKTRQARSRRKRLERTEFMEAPFEDRSSLRLRLRESRRGGSLTVRVADGEFGYPGNPLLKEVRLEIVRGDRVGLLGGNGSGKSTLLRTLTGELPLLSGRIEWGPNNDVLSFSQEPDLGEEGRTVLECLRELDSISTDEELRSFAARFLFQREEVDKRVEYLSGGERSRLALARLFYRPSNVLLLDEPTNHLDIPAREALEEALCDFPGSVLIVSHDLYFLRRVAGRFLLIREGRLQPLDRLEELHAALPERTGDPRIERPAPEGTRRKPSPSKGLSKNERLRRRRRLARLEAEIEEVERRQARLLQALQDPGQEFERLQELSREHESLESRLGELYEKWEEAGRELQE